MKVPEGTPQFVAEAFDAIHSNAITQLSKAADKAWAAGYMLAISEFADMLAVKADQEAEQRQENIQQNLRRIGG